MRVGYFESEPGHKSMMRLLAFIAAILASILVGSGIVIGFIVVFDPAAPGGAINMAIAFTGSGAGMLGLSEWMKERQSRSEISRPSVTTAGGTSQHDSGGGP